MIGPGDSFGDYTVVRLLGKGGMGAVFLLEAADGRQIAAKILDPESAGDEESRKRFLREAELAMGVKHPNLVETYDVGEDPDTGLCYILMEYVPGGSLSDRIKRGPLPINDAISIAYQIAAVLELARQKGIVHRDIKPDNIMFGADGKAKLADLGIARQGGATVTTVTQTGMMIGTPAYMAPEQMLDSHHVDTRADIYSLGIVFYEMLVGKRPNADDTVVQLMAKAVAGEPIPDVRQLRPEVSASLAELIGLMCAMKADERVQTPSEVTLALSQIVHGREVTVRRKRPTAPVAAEKSAKRPAGDRSRLVVAVVFGLLALVGVGVFGYHALHRAKPQQVPVRAETPQLPETRVETVVREVTNTVAQTVVATNVVERTVAPEPAVAKPAGRPPHRPLIDGRRINWCFREMPPQSAEADGRIWWYRLTEFGEAVLMRRKWKQGDQDDAGAGSCVSPVPTGELVLPRQLGGHPVVGIGPHAFSDCRDMTSVVIPEGVVVIESWAFYRCSGLSGVRLPDSVRMLGNGVFLHCDGIRFIDLNLVEAMPYGTALPKRCREYKVSDRNPSYVVTEDGLYSKDRTTLVRYLPVRMSAPLPASVIKVFDAALVGLQQREVALPDQIQEVGREVFLPSPEEIRFGKGFRRLSAGAFYACENLQRVVFEGDAPEIIPYPNHPERGLFESPQPGRTPLTVYVHKSSKGWKRSGEQGLPDCWPEGGDPAHARPIRYLEDGFRSQADEILAGERFPPLPAKTFKLPRRQTLELVGCPAGKFTMGYRNARKDHKEGALHDVSITRPFWIGKYPVTREQWLALGMSAQEQKPAEKALGGLKAPITNVNLPMVREFCQALTRRLRSGLPKGYVFRLPTDAEWEYAARGGSSDERDPHVRHGQSDAVKGEFAVKYEDRLMRLKRANVKFHDDGWINSLPFEVGTKKPNGWGIHDMLGNVDEWLLDTFPMEGPGGVSRKSGEFVTDLGGYQALETDPLRSYDDADAIGMCRATIVVAARRFVLPSTKVLPLGFRVVLGPDLEREKKHPKKAKRK